MLRTGADRDVDPVFHKVEGRTGQQELDADFRIARHELGQPGLELQPRESVRHRQPQHARWLRVAAAGKTLRLVDRGEAAGGRLVHRLAGLGHVDPPGGAPEQLAAKTGFEFLNLAADRRRRQSELARRADEGAAFDHADEDQEVVVAWHRTGAARQELSRITG